ncbi:MAG: N-acetylmuramoyl-L-alanine amidase [Chloroflexi bacterium]|nr:N-acetylmuramoyl-L-alanine amidase [Chloroflexota bacterium]
MNKFGIHLPNGGQYPAFNQMLSMGGDNYTLLDDPGWVDAIKRIKETRPNAVILVRYYHPAWWTVPADEWATMCAAKYDQHRVFTRHCTWANEQNIEREAGINENDSASFRAWYQRINEWNLAFIRNFRQLRPDAILHYPAFACGNQDDYDDKRWGWIGLEICRPSIEASDVLDYHPYWRGGGFGLWDDNEMWYAFRFTLGHALFPDKPIYISETGNFSPRDYNFAEQMTHFFNRLYEYPYVIGATPFIWADPTGQHKVNDWQQNPNLGEVVRKIKDAPKPDVPFPQPPFKEGEVLVMDRPSMHYQDRRGYPLLKVVLHDTYSPVNTTPEDTLNYLVKNSEEVSTHEYIMPPKAGVVRVVRMVDPSLASNAVGWSVIPGYNSQPSPGAKPTPNANWCTFNIEMFKSQADSGPFPEAQYKAMLDRIVKICRDYKLGAKDVLLHREIDTRGKIDPRGILAEKVRADVAALLGEPVGGYTSHYVLMAQNIPVSWRRALEKYFDTFKCTNGQSHDDAMAYRGKTHYITFVGAPDCEYGVPQEVEDYIKERAPDVQTNRMMARTAEELAAIANDRAERGNPYA